MRSRCRATTSTPIASFRRATSSRCHLKAWNNTSSLTTAPSSQRSGARRIHSPIRATPMRRSSSSTKTSAADPRASTRRRQFDAAGSARSSANRSQKSSSATQSRSACHASRRRQMPSTRCGSWPTIRRCRLASTWPTFTWSPAHTGSRSTCLRRARRVSRRQLGCDGIAAGSLRSRSGGGAPAYPSF